MTDKVDTPKLTESQVLDLFSNLSLWLDTESQMAMFGGSETRLIVEIKYGDKTVMKDSIIISDDS
jgi:hypothetical protein